MIRPSCRRRGSLILPCRWRSACRGLMWPTRSSCAAHGQMPGRPLCCRWRRAQCQRRPRPAACASASASRSCRRAAGRLGELRFQEHARVHDCRPPALATAGCWHTAPLLEPCLFNCLVQLCLHLEASAARMPRWRRRSVTAQLRQLTQRRSHSATCAAGCMQAPGPCASMRRRPGACVMRAKIWSEKSPIWQTLQKLRQCGSKRSHSPVRTDMDREKHWPYSTCCAGAGAAAVHGRVRAGRPAGAAGRPAALAPAVAARL